MASYSLNMISQWIDTSYILDMARCGESIRTKGMCQIDWLASVCDPWGWQRNPIQMRDATEHPGLAIRNVSNWVDWSQFATLIILLGFPCWLASDQFVLENKGNPQWTMLPNYLRHLKWSIQLIQSKSLIIRINWGLLSYLATARIMMPFIVAE